MLKRYQKNISESHLLRAGVLLTSANILTGVLQYVYQIVVGRMLEPAEFALYSTIMALSMFCSSPLGAMFNIISKRVSTLRAYSGFRSLNILYRNAHFIVLMSGILCGLIFLVYSEDLQSYAKSPTESSVWIFFFIVAFGAFFQINNAFFQGSQRFGWLCGSVTLSVTLKFVFSLLLIYWGFGVSGALIGVLLSSILVWLFGVSRIINYYPETEQSEQAAGKFPYSYILPVLIANVAFSVMTQLDMVLVNHYFTAEEAGLYAAASVLGKAVLYLPSGLVMALFPFVAENRAKNESSAHILVQSAAVTAVLCGAAAIFYWLTADLLVDMLFGQEYEGAGELLRWYGFAIFPMALTMVAEYFLIAQGRVLFTWLFLCMAPIQIFAIYLWHDELWMIVMIIGVCSTSLAVMGYGYLFYQYYLKASRRKKN